MAIDYTAEVRQIKSRIRRWSRSGQKYLTNFNQYQNSIEIQRVAEDTKFFGQVVIQRLNLKMREYTTPYSTDDRWTIQLYDAGTTDYEENFPYFYTTEVHTNENTNEKSITAYDRLKLLEGYTVANLNLTPPYTIEQFANKIARVRGFSADCLFTNIDSDLLSLSYSEGANLEDTDSLLDCLGWIAEVLGAICYVDNTNKIVFKRLDRDGAAAHTIERNDYFKLSSSDSKRLGKIIYATELGDNIEAHTTAAGSTQVCRNNAFLDNRTDRAALIQKAITDMGGLTIGVFDMQWRGNPNISLGDKIQIELKDGSLLPSYLLDEVITFNGALSSRLRFYWDQNKETDDNANPTTIGEAVYQTYAKVDKVNKRIDLVASDVQTNTEHISGITDDLESIDSRVTTSESKIGSLEVTTENITGTVSNISSRTETLESKTTTIEGNVDDLQDYIDNLYVGGRNIALATGTAITVKPYQDKSWCVPTNFYKTTEYGLAQLANTDNTKFTVSFDWAATGIETAVNAYPALRYTSTGTYSRVYASMPMTVGECSGHASATFTPNEGQREFGTGWMISGFGTENRDAEITISNFKFEVGNVATKWTPAPEDVAAAQITADGAVTTITEVNQQVTTNKNDISQLKIDKQSITADVSSLQETTSQLGQKVTTVEGTANTAKSTADSAITQIQTTSQQVTTNKNDIAQLKIDKNAITQQVGTIETNLTTTNNTVAALRTDVDNIDVGARNLVLDGATEVEATTSATAFTKVIKQLTNYGKTVLGIVGTKATISFDAKANVDGVKMSGRYIRNSGGTIVCDVTNKNQNITLTSEYVRYSGTCSITAEGAARFEIYIPAQTAGDTIYIKNVKIELGTVPTTYTPAPEDVDSGIAAAQSTADGVRTDLTTTQTQVETNRQNIGTLTTSQTAITGRVSSLESTTTTITNTIGTIQSDIDSLAVGGRNLFIAATRTNNSYYKQDGTLDAWGKSVLSDYIPVKEGETVIAQFWKPENTTAAGNDRGWEGIATFNSDKSFKSRLTTYYFTEDYKSQKFVIPAGAAYIRVAYHFGVDGPTGANWNPYGDFQVKVEKGTMPTEWSIAPEDLESDFTTIRSSITTVSDNVGELTTTVNSIKGRVSSVEETTTSHTGAIGDLQTYVDQLQVGGRNLLLDTNAPSLTKVAAASNRFFANSYSYITPSYVSFDDAPLNIQYGVRYVVTATGTGNRNYGFYSGSGDFPPFVDGETYTVSLYARIVDCQKMELRPFYWRSASVAIKSVDITNTDWQRYNFTFTYNAAGCGDTDRKGANLYFGGRATYLGTLEMCGFKLEQGTLGTDWAPAPEDVDYSVYTAQNTADTATETISEVTSRVGELETTTTSIRGTVSSHTTSISTLTTAMDNLGTRNYIINTLNPVVNPASMRPMILGQTSNSTYGGNTIDIAEHGVRVTSTAAVRPFFRMGSTSTTEGTLNGLEAGETYSLSFDASWKLLSGTISNTTTYYFRAYLYTKTAAADAYVNTAYYTIGTITNAKRGTEMTGRCELTFTVPENAVMLYIFVGANYQTAAGYAAGDYVELRNLQLEKGSVVTDYCPAPEDYKNAIDDTEESLSADIGNTQSAVDTITSSVDDLTTGLDTVKKDLTENTQTLVQQINDIKKEVNMKMTDSEVTIAINEAISNGVKSVETETGYKFDKDGLTIAKSDSDLKTLVDNTGMTVSNSFEDVLTATNAGVDTVNLTTRNYLIVGTRLLIQDYGSGSVGFFYIGDE